MSFANMNGIMHGTTTFEEELRDAEVRKTTSKLQAVFRKLTGVLPTPVVVRGGDLGAVVMETRKMSGDIIESVLGDVPIPQPLNFAYDSHTTCTKNECEHPVCTLAKRLEVELRAAKQTHLDCGEVLLPCGLLQRIAYDVIAMAECEPCGLRGCTLYVNFEGRNTHCHRCLGVIRCDPFTTPTFELYLTVKEAGRGWNTYLPQFLR